MIYDITLRAVIMIVCLCHIWVGDAKFTNVLWTLTFAVIFHNFLEGLTKI